MYTRTHTYMYIYIYIYIYKYIYIPSRSARMRFKVHTVSCQCVRSGSEAGSYLRLIDGCITQLKAQGPSRNCNERKEEVPVIDSGLGGVPREQKKLKGHLPRVIYHQIYWYTKIKLRATPGHTQEFAWRQFSRFVGETRQRCIPPAATTTGDTSPPG